jgi:hypothetical protein
VQTDRDLFWNVARSFEISEYLGTTQTVLRLAHILETAESFADLAIRVLPSKEL